MQVHGKKSKAIAIQVKLNQDKSYAESMHLTLNQDKKQDKSYAGQVESQNRSN